MFKRFLSVILVFVLLPGCGGQQSQQTTSTPSLTPIPTSTHTPVPTSTNTPTPTLTPTPTPLPLAGPVADSAMTRLGKGWVNDLEFSPNGKILSVATSIGVYLYQVETMELIAFIPGSSFVKDTVFIDDETLVVGSKDGTTTVWNIKETPKILESLQRPDLVVALGVTEEKSILIVELGGSGASGSVNIIIWDRTSPENAKKVSSEYVFDGRYSSTKNLVALSTWMSNVILIDTQRMRTTATMCRKCSSFALSQTGDLFAANQWLGGSNYQTLLLDTTSQKEIAKFSEGGNPLAFSPDGKLLVSSSSSGLSFWSIETFELVNAFDGDDAFIATFSPDGSLLAFVSRDGDLVLRETASGDTKFMIQGFTSLGKTIFQKNYILSTYEYDGINVLDIAAGGRGFYSSDGRTIYFRDVLTGDVIRSIELTDEEKNQLGALSSITFSPDGRILASEWGNWNSQDRTILLLNADTGERLKTLSGFGPIAFSSNTSLLATSGSESRLIIWDITSGEQLPVSLGLLPATFGEPYQKSLLFSPNNEMIVILSDQVLFRDILTGKRVKTFEGGFDPWLGSFDRGGSAAIGAFSPNGKVLASTWLTASRERTIRNESRGIIVLWDVESEERIAVLDGHSDPILGDYSNPITALVFSPDGRYLVSGAKDNTIIVWDVQTGSLLKVLQGHTGAINSLAFTPDGKLLYSNAMDGTIVIWNLDQLLP